VTQASDSFQIETAGWRDMKALHALEKSCFKEDAWPLVELLGVLTFPGVVRIKAVASGSMVGFIAGDANRGENTGWILTLGVQPEMRRRGIAGALLKECERLMDMATVKLTVRRGNLAAIGLYEKLGYRKVDVWPRYYRNGEDGLVFEKILESPAG